MTPHRDQSRGTFVLDRRCGKLGRIKLASGTTDPDVFDELNAMITRLKRDRRWDLLGLLAQRLVSPLDLADAVYRGQTGTLPAPEELRPVSRAVATWLETADLSPRTKDDYAVRLTVAPTVTIAKLPDVLRADRAAAIASGKRSTFNNRLDAARSFLRDVVTPMHRLYLALPAPLELTRREGNPQEPERIRALALGWQHADILWALCLTAMRQSEYWGTWEVLSDRITIQGAKGRLGAPMPRVVPLVYRPARPAVAYSTFFHQLSERTDGQVNVHDLRKTAQRWWEDAGVLDWRISLYAGHAKGRKSLATIYRKPRDLTRLLQEDADRIRTWLGDPPQIGLRVASA